MKTLFEMPKLLTLDGDPFSGELKVYEMPPDCVVGCCPGSRYAGSGKNTMSKPPL